MAQSSLKAGDLVTLKSEGPEMTINEVITSSYFMERTELAINKVITQWFN